MWNFATDPEFQQKLDWMETFIRDEIEPLDYLFPKDETYNVNNAALMAILDPLKKQVRNAGLWACHLPPALGGGGWGQLKLALMNELLGRSFFAPTIFGTAAPDTGNAEILAHFGTEAQKAKFLRPLLDGDIVSCFSMTEPQGGADPKIFTCAASRRGDHWILSGEKWFASNARWADFLIVMVVTDPDVTIYRGASMFLIPTATPGVEFLRNAGMAFEDPAHGAHAYLRFNEVQLTDADLLGKPGDAFKIAQTRLGGGRVHHAMRTVGLAKRAFEAVCERVQSRTTQGDVLAAKQMVQAEIADLWMEIEQFRLLVLQTAWKIDRHNDYKLVRQDIAACKVLSERVMVSAASKAIHLHGALGISNEMLFGEWLLWGYALGLADGPSEVHQVTVAKEALGVAKTIDELFPSSHVPSGARRMQAKYAKELELPGHRRGWVN
ncbi:MAG: acyl-CoA dehydrogenase family protein [Proteobacteria bacterium]|nr:acyl-CoA dehydrogenase family protein [Pseudomonadota bacterium]